MKYKEIMNAEMKPDIYGGNNCDEINPQWKCESDGDMEEEILNEISLDAKSFPAGTKISISIPCCPQCGEDVECCVSGGECDFNWGTWRDSQYS